jgi:hypothetical protein
VPRPRPPSLGPYSVGVLQRLLERRGWYSLPQEADDEVLVYVHELKPGRAVPVDPEGRDFSFNDPVFRCYARDIGISWVRLALELAEPGDGSRRSRRRGSAR